MNYYARNIITQGICSVHIIISNMTVGTLLNITIIIIIQFYILLCRPRSEKNVLYSSTSISCLTALNLNKRNKIIVKKRLNV